MNYEDLRSKKAHSCISLALRRRTNTETTAKLHGSYSLKWLYRESGVRGYVFSNKRFWSSISSRSYGLRDEVTTIDRNVYEETRSFRTHYNNALVLLLRGVYLVGQRYRPYPSFHEIYRIKVDNLPDGGFGIFIYR